MRLKVAGSLAVLLLPLGCSETSDVTLPDASHALKTSLTQYAPSSQLQALTTSRFEKGVDLASLPRGPAADDEPIEPMVPPSLSKPGPRPGPGEFQGLAAAEFSETKAAGIRFLQTAPRYAQE